MNENLQPKSLAQRIRNARWFVVITIIFWIALFCFVEIKFQKPLISIPFSVLFTALFYYGISSFLAETLSNGAG
jgi:hypothetical protein